MGARCASCGGANPSTARVCVHCGAPMVVDPTTESLDAEALAQALDDHEADLEQFPVHAGLLVVKRGPKAGSRYALDADVVTAGRHPDSDIFLDDVTVSRRHAEILREGARYRVRDVGSLNGTYVNRKRVDEALLHDGDELQVGMFKLVFFHGTRPVGG